MTPRYRLIHLLVIVAICVFAVPLFSQKIRTVKLYSHFAFNGAISVPTIDKEPTGLLAFKWLAPALLIDQTENRYHEFELTDFFLQRAPDEETDTRFSIGFRYERGWRLNKLPAGNTVVRIGLSVKNYYGLEQLNELNPTGWPLENRLYGLSLALNPHVEYRVFRELYFDFSPYCDLLSVAARSEYIYNEFIDVEQRQSIDFYTLSMKFFLRFGLAWRF